MKRGFLTIAIIVAFIFAYPRFLGLFFDNASPWMSYFYLYGFGLVTFVIGMRLIIKSGACQPGRGDDTLWYRLLIGGYVFFFSLHGIWILLSLHVPFKGGVQ